MDRAVAIPRTEAGRMTLTHLSDIIEMLQVRTHSEQIPWVQTALLEFSPGFRVSMESATVVVGLNSDGEYAIAVINEDGDVAIEGAAPQSDPLGAALGEIVDLAGRQSRKVDKSLAAVRRWLRDPPAGGQRRIK